MIWKILAISAALAAGGVFWWWVTRLGRRRVLRHRRDRGRRGEVDAAQVLVEAGYHLLQDQASREAEMEIDGVARPYTVRPDYLVRRGNRRYVAEVKTGKKAPNPLYTPTRRQLLEYEVCFPTHGLLLVDMETRRVHRIRWAQVDAVATSRAPSRRLSLWLGLAFGLGLCLGACTRLL